MHVCFQSRDRKQLENRDRALGTEGPNNLESPEFTDQSKEKAEFV